jgi:hypothetical protein
MSDRSLGCSNFANGRNPGSNIMHKSFPVLTHLDLESEDETLEMLVDPDLFLGGYLTDNLRFGVLKHVVLGCGE